eukprot:CAMPEP_0185534170 /NCGR_PEP_ID=MMETSP1366-20130426/108813_1 /TAXON_ID=38817 /ORGANISM="Gephyrocapsa oceanica, Strain RCC1303" /LENGTH=703 /DNA_ID=CAMNT_0028145895 /DNA_START=48 /DNA_END=2156 /DNA_ORIENTATION=+
MQQSVGQIGNTAITTASASPAATAAAAAPTRGVPGHRMLGANQSPSQQQWQNHEYVAFATECQQLQQQLQQAPAGRSMEEIVRLQQRRRQQQQLQHQQLQHQHQHQQHQQAKRQRQETPPPPPPPPPQQDQQQQDQQQQDQHDQQQQQHDQQQQQQQQQDQQEQDQQQQQLLLQQQQQRQQQQQQPDYRQETPPPQQHVVYTIRVPPGVDPGGTFVVEHLGVHYEITASDPPREDGAVECWLPAPPGHQPVGQPEVEIQVCQAGACRRAGSEAVLLEIEELGAGLRCLSVSAADGCFGACDEAPNAIVVRRGTEVLQSRLDKVEKTAALVAAATGATPNLDDPALRQRLKEARQVRARQQAREEKRWNAAMQGLAEQVAASADESKRLDLLLELAELEEAAGQWEAALEHRRELQAASPDQPHEILDLATILGKMGRVREIDELQRLAEVALSDPEDAELLEHASEHIADCRVDAARSASVGAAEEVERPIDGYALWRLDSATPVSRHSALYRFSSEDRTRGTPLGKSAGAEMRHMTWHLTMLARVGPNAEGPLPWVERDYTPVSTWMDWVKGRCDILIKTYRPGDATGWLRELPLGSAVHLSQPLRTLDVPSLVPDSSALDEASLGHSGVLLLLAGTGIAVAASVLRHADPASCFRPPGRSRRPAAPPLKSPVRLIYACRRDDVLMAPEIAKWCSAGVGRAR